VARAFAPESPQFVTGARLSAYAQARGRAVEEADSDSVHRAWRQMGGEVCYTHAEDGAEVMLGDVEPAAVAEGTGARPFFCP
jgi:hypothetical protein